MQAGRFSSHFILRCLQLLQPVLTFGLLVLARLCFGGPFELVELAVGAGDGGPFRWLVPGAIVVD